LNNKPYQRSELIYKDKIEKIKKSNIIIFGLGGVGSVAAESISRNFIENLTVVDYDTYEVSNLNRQLYSNYDNIGRKKVDVFKENIEKHCRDTKIIARGEKVTEFNIEEFFDIDYDYVIDAVDDVKAKLAIIKYCKDNNIPVISCMGTGNRINPEMLTIDDIFKTFNCPLAKKMRKELKRLGVLSLDAVFSKEKPVETVDKKLGSTSFVPGSAGLLLASYVINKIAFEE
jgi:tRNA A37 threonylcarbamoyladenosine dehydratase